MNATILTGDVLDKLRTLPDTSVQCVVTSPPYWGLRDYQVDGQIGIEPTPAAYVARMVEVFREVRRVLRDDGCVWLNLGDSYAGSGVHSASHANPGISKAGARGADVATPVPEGLKPKDLCGIPWRVAFALQDDGWWLRSDIIWAKPNPMPESVTDRPTKAHEYIFLLTKSARYFYDADAIREEPQSRPKAVPEGYHSDQRRQDDMEKYGMSRGGNGLYGSVATTHPNGRNARTVWTIATQPYPEAHFATFPEELPRRCILAGTSSHGCCPECGAPWERVVEKGLTAHDGDTDSRYATGTTANRLALLRQASRERGGEYVNGATTTGWRPTCVCHGHFETVDDGEDWITAETGTRRAKQIYVPDDSQPAPVPCTVLDPFAGSGTTLAVALALGRHAIGIELNPEYVKLAQRRLAGVTPALFGV